jgi:hypothetical protein
VRNSVKFLSALAATIAVSVGLPLTSSAATLQPASETHTCIPPWQDKICSDAKVDLNIRAQSNTTSRILGTVPAGIGVVIYCYVTGASVNGDAIWYYGGGPEGETSLFVAGYLAGYYVNTGADPVAGATHC